MVRLFFHYWIFCFAWMMMSFYIQKIFSFLKSHLVIVILDGCVISILFCSENSFLCQWVQDSSPPRFYQIQCMWSDVKILYPFGFESLCNVASESILVVYIKTCSVTLSICWRCFFSLVVFFASCQKSWVSRYGNLCLDLQFDSIDQHVYFYDYSMLF